MQHFVLSAISLPLYRELVGQLVHLLDGERHEFWFGLLVVAGPGAVIDRTAQGVLDIDLAVDHFGDPVWQFRIWPLLEAGVSFPTHLAVGADAIMNVADDDAGRGRGAARVNQP